MIAVAAADRERFGFGARAGVGVDRLAGGDVEAFGDEGFKTTVVRASRDGALDFGQQQSLEDVEDDILKRDGQGRASGSGMS